MSEVNQIAEVLESAIRQTYGRNQGFIPLHAPYLKGNENIYMQDCINSGWVSSVGSYVDRFEQEISRFTGSKFSVATVNGTAALHMSLLLSGVNPGDEVLCPAFSFVATVSAIVYCKAHPVFMDSNLKSMGMDPLKVKLYLKDKCFRGEDGNAYNKATGRRIKACIIMHAYGYPVETDLLIKECQAYGIHLIEDAAEALGSYYAGKHCGTLGDIGILSFNGNKIVTTGGGGMILSNDGKLAEKAKHLTTTAKVKHPWLFIHDDVGYNYRMPNINAALGCAQMERLPWFLETKMKQANAMREILKGIENIEVYQPYSERVNHWFNLIKVPIVIRDDIIEKLNERGIQARAAWSPLCDMGPYTDYEKFEIENVYKIFNSIICLPNGILQ